MKKKIINIIIKDELPFTSDINTLDGFEDF